MSIIVVIGAWVVACAIVRFLEKDLREDSSEHGLGKLRRVEGGRSRGRKGLTWL